MAQFVVWVVGMLQGDFGTSIFSNLPVSRLILQRLEPTVSLTLATLVVAVCLAIPLGVLAAWKARRLVDRLVMGFAVMGFAMPVFLVGYVLIYLFAVRLGWLPVQGYRPLAEGLWPWAESLILPSLALGIFTNGITASAVGPPSLPQRLVFSRIEISPKPRGPWRTLS